MTTSDLDVAAIADALHLAHRDRAAIEPVTTTWPTLDVATAYRVQQHNLHRDLDGGERLAGHKIGLTSAAMQELLGVDEPDYGYLLDSMVHRDGAPITRDGFLQPRAEPEIAVQLHRPLRGPGISADDVRAATGSVAPALEIVDSRVRDWQITLVDTIADNASSAAAVVGTWVPIGDVPPLAEVACALTHNGEVVGRGTGRDVLGDPLAAIAWLGNAVGPHGVTLEPGQLLLPGSLTTAVFVHPGDRITADFGPLGRVGFSVT